VAEPKTLKELLEEAAWTELCCTSETTTLVSEMAERLRMIDALHAKALGKVLLDLRVCRACGDIEPCATRKALEGVR